MTTAALPTFAQKMFFDHSWVLLSGLVILAVLSGIFAASYVTVNLPQYAQYQACLREFGSEAPFGYCNTLAPLEGAAEILFGAGFVTTLILGGGILIFMERRLKPYAKARDFPRLLGNVADSFGSVDANRRRKN